MATMQLDIADSSTIDEVAISEAGDDLSNTLLVEFDSTATEGQVLSCLEKARQALVEYFAAN